jgi:glycerol-3-phosphate dehydrogenase
MAVVADFSLTHNKTQMLLLDKRLKGLVNGIIFTPPTPGEFAGIAPRRSGNPYVLCGSYNPTADKEDTATTRQWFRENLTKVRDIVPSVSERDIITAFVGIRAFNTRNPEDHIIEASGKNPRFINMAIRLPGIAISIAASKYVVSILHDEGLDLVEKADFNPYRKGIPSFSEFPDEKRRLLIAQDSRYGHIVCRCETVTEGEIVEAIKRGATTVQGIQFRTRAGMGRCQRGFCGPRVVSILARELGIPITKVTQKGPGSTVLLYNSKELLRGRIV